MKNKQKGFIVPLIIIIVAALAISGGVYVHQKNKANVETAVNSDIQATTSVTTTTPKPEPVHTSGTSSATITSSTSVNVAIPIATTSTSVNGQTTLQGEYVCLPHANTAGPQTMECAFGLKTNASTYYALSLDGGGTDSLNLSTGSMVKVTGIVVPIEEISSNIWQKYNIKGIVSVQSIVKI